MHIRSPGSHIPLVLHIPRLLIIPLLLGLFWATSMLAMIPPLLFMLVVIRQAAVFPFSSTDVLLFTELLIPLLNRLLVIPFPFLEEFLLDFLFLPPPLPPSPPAVGLLDVDEKLGDGDVVGAT